MSRKAQGMSISFIILIVLGLVIVGVLIFMIGGKVRQFGKSTGGCVEKKGTCMDATKCEGAIVGALDCPKKEPDLENPVCCVSYKEEETPAKK